MTDLFTQLQSERRSYGVDPLNTNQDLAAFHRSDDMKDVTTENDKEPHVEENDRDTLSLEARNEKEVQLHDHQVTAEAQLGQKKVEAVALVWTKKTVYFTYVWVWIGFFMLALQLGTTQLLNNAAYVEFGAIPDLAVAYVLASVIGGVLKLPIAKVLNIWGRAEAFFVFVVVYIIGMIIIGSSKGKNTFAAGYVIYWIGYYGLYLILDVFVADTSGLKNRAFAFAFVQTPFICTAFTAPLLGAAFIASSGWRWGYGAFTLINFAVFMPLVAIFKYYERKAIVKGLYNPSKSGRTVLQSTIHYTHEFDIVGCFLLMAAFILLLLPFAMSTNGLTQYKESKFIVQVVLGLLLFPVFAVWEYKFAKVQFIKWELFKQRTVLGACCLAAIVFFSFYSWDLYFYQFNIVVHNLTLRDAGYMMQIWNIGSCFWGVVFGAYVRWTKHFKWPCLFFGLPLMILGAGLMIYFRGQDHGLGYLVMCQLFIAFGGGTLAIGQDMAVMAASDREGVPMMLSIIGLAASVGGSFGYAVSNAIYSNTFPKALQSRLPDSQKGNWTAIYNGGYGTQLEYPKGSPVRDAADYAWGQSQKFGAICATCVLVLGFPSIIVWKNYNVDKKQNKGTVI